MAYANPKLFRDGFYDGMHQFRLRFWRWQYLKGYRAGRRFIREVEQKMKRQFGARRRTNP